MIEADALGAPDTDAANLVACAGGGPCNFLTLRHGGSAVFKFTDNVLSGSGDSAEDLFIFETGPFTQGMNVEISQDGSTWHSVGSVIGDVDGVDIDQFLPGLGLTRRDSFRYVRLTDDNIIGNGTPSEFQRYYPGDTSIPLPVADPAALRAPPDGRWINSPPVVMKAPGWRRGLMFLLRG